MLVFGLVVVSVVCGSVNSTDRVGGTSPRTDTVGGSRMAWMKALLDQHGWSDFLSSGNLTLQQQCREDLGIYLAALNNGKLWASRSKFQYYI